MNEGSVIAWRTSRFEHCSTHSVVLSQLVERHPDIAAVCEQSIATKTLMMSRPAILQVAATPSRVYVAGGSVA